MQDKFFTICSQKSYYCKQFCFKYNSLVWWTFFLENKVKILLRKWLLTCKMNMHQINRDWKWSSMNKLSSLSTSSMMVTSLVPMWLVALQTYWPESWRPTLGNTRLLSTILCLQGREERSLDHVMVGFGNPLGKIKKAL